VCLPFEREEFLSNRIETKPTAPKRKVSPAKKKVRRQFKSSSWYEAAARSLAIGTRKASEKHD